MKHWIQLGVNGRMRRIEVEPNTGRLEYAVDIRLPDMLVAKVLRSPFAHARILRIDTSRAEALPGVEAGITHRDVPVEEWKERSFNFLGRVLDDRARFAGDEIAAVAAVDARVAEAGLRLIEIEWDELPHVFNMMEALELDIKNGVWRRRTSWAGPPTTCRPRPSPRCS